MKDLTPNRDVALGCGTRPRGNRLATVADHVDLAKLSARAREGKIKTTKDLKGVKLLDGVE
ncbi:MAG: hypothetical protein ACPG77_13980, partial [Nannocystaceae bacterium]